MKRNSVVDQFEAVYLREKTAKRAFAKPEAIASLLKDPDFERCTRYMSRRTFAQNKSVLLKHGFDQEDMFQVVRFLGLLSVADQFNGKTKKDNYYILMRFIGQKLQDFYVFLNRKFKINENYLELSTESDSLSYGYRKGTAGLIAHPEPVEEVKMIREPVAVRKQRKSDMKKMLDENVGKYEDRLAELATSKMVDFEVRKKARKFCKNYGIDYVKWARAQIESRSLNEYDFVLE